MEVWFEIIEVTLREGRVRIKGHWMRKNSAGDIAPRNVHTQPINLEPMMPRELFEHAVQEALGELATSKKGQPVEREEKDEITASAENSNPLYMAMENLLKAAAHDLSVEMGMEVKVQK